MTDEDTPQRIARRDERCSCGRPAVLVFQTEKFGEIPWCGLEMQHIAWERHQPERRKRPR